MTVVGDPDLTHLGSLLAEPARSRMLLALSDGRALPAGVLASEAGVAASTATGHLQRLCDGGLLAVERHGRHRYYRLANAEVAGLIERLSSVSPRVPVRSLRQDTKARALRSARTCYDHLAGQLGVGLLAALLDRGWLAGHDGSFRTGVDRLSAPGPDVAYVLTEQGEQRLGELGVQCRPATRRPLIRHCVDWSEQRHHLAGHLGAALADRCFQLGWIARSNVPRAVTVTDAGRSGLAEAFGVAPEAYL